MFTSLHDFIARILCMQKLTTNRHVEFRERAQELVEQARREAARRSVVQQTSSQVVY